MFQKEKERKKERKKENYLSDPDEIETGEDSKQQWLELLVRHGRNIDCFFVIQSPKQLHTWAHKNTTRRFMHMPVCIYLEPATCYSTVPKNKGLGDVEYMRATSHKGSSLISWWYYFVESAHPCQVSTHVFNAWQLCQVPLKLVQM